MCFKKKKSISREELIEAIMTLEREESYVETLIKSLATEINLMIECGGELKDNFDKIFMVKKIMILNEERLRASKKAIFLLYNIKLSKRLRDIMDEKELMGRISGLSHFDFLKDQKELAFYLNETLETNTKFEDILTDADDIFVDIERKFIKNNKIYGLDDINEERLMELFEMDNSQTGTEIGENKSINER